MEYKIIKMNTSDLDELKILTDVNNQYNDICKSVGKTRALKSTSMFKPLWEPIEDVVSALSYTPIYRMKPESEHEVYSTVNNVVAVCINEKGELLGFLGGVVNVYDILINYDSSPALDTYDRTKYKSIYAHLVPFDDTAPPPISWIEIICVHPESRGKGVTIELINMFISHCKVEEKSDDLVVGLDIVGTLKGGINCGLKKVYQKLGFDFSMPDNMSIIPQMFNGAQFAGRREKIDTTLK